MAFGILGTAARRFLVLAAIETPNKSRRRSSPNNLPWSDCQCVLGSISRLVAPADLPSPVMKFPRSGSMSPVSTPLQAATMLYLSLLCILGRSDCAYCSTLLAQHSTLDHSFYNCTEKVLIGEPSAQKVIVFYTGAQISHPYIGCRFCISLFEIVVNIYRVVDGR